jgi:hypothetical protein
VSFTQPIDEANYRAISEPLADGLDGAVSPDAYRRSALESGDSTDWLWRWGAGCASDGQPLGRETADVLIRAQIHLDPDRRRVVPAVGAPVRASEHFVIDRARFVALRSTVPNRPGCRRWGD